MNLAAVIFLITGSLSASYGQGNDKRIISGLGVDENEISLFLRGFRMIEIKIIHQLNLLPL